MAYDNTNTGALFKNEKKTTERHPDYTGSVNVNGKEFFLGAWLKTSKAGKKYMSLSVTSKEALAPPATGSGVQQSIEDDDIPFNYPIVDYA